MTTDIRVTLLHNAEKLRAAKRLGVMTRCLSVSVPRLYEHMHTHTIIRHHLNQSVLGPSAFRPNLNCRTPTAGLLQTGLAFR